MTLKFVKSGPNMIKLSSPVKIEKNHPIFRPKIGLKSHVFDLLGLLLLSCTMIC